MERGFEVERAGEYAGTEVVCVRACVRHGGHMRKFSSIWFLGSAPESVVTPPFSSTLGVAHYRSSRQLGGRRVDERPLRRDLDSKTRLLRR